LDDATTAPRRSGLALRMQPPPIERHGAEDDKDVNQPDDSPGSHATRMRYLTDGDNLEEAVTRDASHLPTEIDRVEPPAPRLAQADFTAPLASRRGLGSSRRTEGYHGPWALHFPFVGL